MSAQIVEQAFGLLQNRRIETFGEPPIDRSEQIARFAALALIAPEPGRSRAARSSQNLALCRCATASALWKLSSAGAWSCIDSNSVLRTRYVSVSAQRSCVLSSNAIASAARLSPSSGCPSNP